MSISIIILTHNEEANLPRCIASVAPFDDVLVFDSFSTDRTVEIARTSGARVVQHRFEGYAVQRCAALDDPGLRHQWVFMLDADEVMTEPLAAEIRRAVAGAAPDQNLFRVRRQDMFLGRWIRRASGYPTWFGRLMRRGLVEIRREINEEYVAAGPVGHLEQHLLHFPFHRGVAHWLDRHNRYSSMEAELLVRQTVAPATWRDLLSADPVVRRRALKQAAYRVPARPLWVFLYLYFVRLGLLEGIAGLYYCGLRACYELMIDVKATELKRNDRDAR